MSLFDFRFVDCFTFVSPNQVRSDTSTTKTMELTFDNRPVALKIVSYDPDKVGTPRRRTPAFLPSACCVALTCVSCRVVPCRLSCRLLDPLTLSKINVAIVVFSVVVPSTLDSALTNVRTAPHTLT